MAPSTPRLGNASPFFRTTSSRPKSPTKDEPSLRLQQVIGTTTTSSPGFDCVQHGSTFAFAAGSGAVVASIIKDGKTSQRFFHARPSASPLITTPSIYDSPTPSTGQGARQRTAASLRESGYGVLSPPSPSRDSSETSSSRSGAASRTKAATCIALSPDGKLLAIGETGHKPRVLVFSTARDAARDTPQNALAEHTFGVRCLAFSPDSQYLASLGDINDGFLYVWALNQRTGTASLKASNRCTSNVRQMIWMGNSLITVGTRHVKVWRLDAASASPSKRFSDASSSFGSPSSRTLLGRNCLLGALLDKTFTAATAISHVQALVCSDAGDICLLDDGDAGPSFTKVADAGFGVSAVAVKTKGYALLAGADGQMKKLDLGSITGLLMPDVTLDTQLVAMESGERSANPAIAMGINRTNLIMIDSERSVKVFGQATSDGQAVTFSLQQSCPAHRAAVLGIRSVALGSANSVFMTWSADGQVIFWNANGTSRSSHRAALEQLDTQTEDLVNELRVANAFGSGRYLVTGDRLGCLRITDIEQNRCIYDMKAHGNEITDVAIHESDAGTIIASSSRDRTVQVFRWVIESGCDHLQTVEEQTGAVTSVAFSDDGQRLICASSDRTIMLLDAVCDRENDNMTAGFLAARPIVLKAAPLSARFVGEQKDSLLVSTTDRQVLRFDAWTGKAMTSFKATEQDGADAVSMSSVIDVPFGRKASLIAGVATSDKSIRIYDISGRLIAKEHGHTEGMMGIVSISRENAMPQIVSVASDGTIFIWDLVQSGQQLQDAFAALSISEDGGRNARLSAGRPPLRKMLSSSELTRLRALQEEREEPGSLSPPKPSLRRKASKLSMVQTPKLEPPSGAGSRRPSTFPSPSLATPDSGQRRRVTGKAPSPTPAVSKPKAQTMRVTTRSAPPPVQPRRRSMSTTPSPTTSALTVSTDSLCRNLHSYRKKLQSSSDIVALESVRELERELSLTAKALAEKSARHETVMAKILDQYSERLVGLLDEKIEQTVAKQMRRRGGEDEGNEEYATNEGQLEGQAR